MNTKSLVPTRARAIGALLSLLSSGRHVALAVPHNLACELVSEDLAEKHRTGAFPTAEHLEALRLNALTNFIAVRRSIVISSLLAALICGSALAVAMALGKVHSSLPPDYGKIVTWVGAFLGIWGAVLQFRPAEESFKGTMLHERLHGLVVRILVVSGAALAALGAIWWQ